MLDRFRVADDIAVRIPQETMRATVEDIFTRLGMTPEDASRGADTLLYADIRGIDSHGVSNMMRAYVHGLENDQINPTPSWQVVNDAGAAVNVDCDEGLGIVVGPQCMDLAIEKAKQNGIGMVTAHNGGHYGAAAYHAQRALAHDMVGLSMTTGGVLVVPTQGAEPMLGLNPIGIAAPTRNAEPYIFDASMSSLAANKIQLLRRVGGTALAGWVAGEDGAPIMEEGPVPEKYRMLPLGGTREIGSHKGYGLMMLVEILTGALSGGGVGPFRRQGSSHFFMAINIAALTGLASFQDDMDEYLGALLASTPAPGEERVVYAGIPEAEDEADRREKGIPYHPEVIEWFKSTVDRLELRSRFN